ncbi:MAG: TerB N-terminal domain-containing protein, partial [Candidatus Methanomethylophilaceae archaeon]|nr:TerB N-terminal domain-containing protein [Candidatus Methanomethylophilaceae archaeon]
MGEPCDYIPSDCSTPDYRILNREQRDYYLYWRAELRKGNCLRTDDGYVWLLLCELINSDHTVYDEAMEMMDLINRECGYLRNRDLVKSTMLDLSI